MSLNRDHTEALEWLSVIGQTTDFGFLVISQDRETVFGNDAAYKYLDFPDASSHKPLQVDDIIIEMSKRGDFGKSQREDHVNARITNIREFLTGDSKTNYVSRIVPPNGRTLDISRMRTPSGKAIVTINDVTERQTQKEIFKIALEISKSGILIINYSANSIELHSKYFESILNTSEMRAIREEGLWPLMHPDDIAAAKDGWLNFLSNETKYECVFRLNTENKGVIWLKHYANLQRSQTGEASTAICHIEDVTEDFKLQDDLRDAKKQAEKTLQAQNNFLARLSHEIRTPMNAVIGITDALVQHNPDTTTLSKLELIQASAESIMNILEGTLNHTKLDANKLMLNPQLGNPANTVRMVSKLWQQQAIKNGTKISCHIDKKVPDEITFDKFRYEQCLNNLVSNAVKFTPNGHVQVILTVSDKDASNPRLILAVKDNGIGMTQEQQTHIFEAYTQADSSISSRFGGTGLGMNIAKQIIEMMGGTISVKSELGKGTIFALSLPLPVKVKEKTPQTADSVILDQMFIEKAPEVTSYSNLKILVADDNPTNHLVVESLLESVVGTLYKANNGQEVLDVLEVQDIDIILMDIHMPIMDGIESTLAIRNSGKHWSDIIIIALTADPQYQQLRLCKNIGMDDSLAKPIKLTGLLESFDRVLNIDRKNANYKQMYQTAG